MHVCLVYDCLFPWTVGGAERWMRNLAEALAADGHRVTFLTRRQWPVDDPPQIDGVEVIAVSREEPLYGPDGNRTIGEPVRFGLGVFRHLARHGGDYDVVHTISFPYFSVLAIAALRRRHGYRVVCDWFEVWSADYWRTYLGGPKGLLARRIQRACVRAHQDTAFCFSALHEQRLREEGIRTDPVVLRGMFPGPMARAEPLPAEDHIVFAGRMIPEKQAPAVVHAAVAARALVPGLRATVFGDGPQLPEVRAAIAEHGAESYVEAPGFVATELVEGTLARALCLVLPTTREGYGLIVLEAASMGVPSVLVAGPDNAATELIEPGVNGVVAADASPQTLAEAIASVSRGGAELRASTAAWFSSHRDELSLQASVDRVLERYR